MKKLCLILGGWGAFLVCLPVIWKIFAGDKFNPLSYFLWSSLSLICTITYFRARRGGHQMMLGYFFSDLSIGFVAYYKAGQMEFGVFESITVFLVFVCVCVYLWCEYKYKDNLTPAVKMNATACMLAGIPQIIESFQNPYQMSFFICGIYMLISAVSYYGGNGFNERLIPGLSIVYWMIFIIVLIIGRRLVLT